MAVSANYFDYFDLNLHILVNCLAISDVAWSPDNLHFASCSTDSTICIWDVNEHAPIKVLDAKANGLTFDPFGKFIAS